MNYIRHLSIKSKP